MTKTFKTAKRNYHIENIYCSIDISNIEKYLKRIETIKSIIKPKIEIVLVPDTFIYNESQVRWCLFIGKNRFDDGENVSKKFSTECLMILSITNQINKVRKEWFLKEGNNKCYLGVVGEGKIPLERIKKELGIVEEKREKIEIERIAKYYKVKQLKNIEEEIIEKMALSAL